MTTSCRCFTTVEGPGPVSTAYSSFLVAFVKDVPKVPPSPHLPPLLSVPFDSWPQTGACSRWRSSVADHGECYGVVRSGAQGAALSVGLYSEVQALTTQGNP